MKKKYFAIIFLIAALCCLTVGTTVAFGESYNTGVTLYKNTVDGAVYDWDADENGWANHAQTSATYVNAAGETVIPAYYGYYGDAGKDSTSNLGYSSYTLVNAGYIANYKALDVTKPIEIRYSHTTADLWGGAWYVMALFDNLETGLKAGNNTWNHAASGAKTSLWGSNNAADWYNGRLIANGQVTSSYFFPESYDKNNWNQYEFVVGIQIGTEKTAVSVNGRHFGWLDVKRSDFANGKAYLTVATGGAIFFTMKISQPDYIEYTNEAGWDMHAQGTGKSVYDGSYAPYSSMSVVDGVTTFVSGGTGYLYNSNALDLTKELNFTINLNTDWVGQQAGFFLNLFDSVASIQAAGVDGWNYEKGAKLVMRGSTVESGAHSDVKNKIEAINRISADANYIGAGNEAVISVYIAENAKDSYVLVNGELLVSPEIARSAFANQKAYLQILSLNTLQYKVKITEAEPQIVHDLVYHEAREATCTKDGNVAYYSCSICGKNYLDADGKTEYTGDVIIPKGHREVSDSAVAATCTKAGLTEGKHCSVCNETLVYQFPTFPTGHKEKVTEGKDATCTEAGYTVKVECENCHTVLVESETIPAKGHSVIGASCEAASKCLRCGEELNKATGHRYADEHTCHDRVCLDCGKVASATTEHEGGTATCTERAKCVHCGEKYGERKAHTYEDGCCTACNAKIPFLKKKEENCNGSIGVGSAFGLLLAAAAVSFLKRKKD